MHRYFFKKKEKEKNELTQKVPHKKSLMVHRCFCDDDERQNGQKVVHEMTSNLDISHFDLESGRVTNYTTETHSSYQLHY